MNPIRVLIVDDHPLIRVGVRRSLESAEGISVAGECADLAETRDWLANSGKAEVVILDRSLFAPSDAQRVNAIEAYQNSKVQLMPLPALTQGEFNLPAPMVTLCIDGGRKEKVRPGDILGALTADKTITADKVGKIDIFDHVAYVAIDRTLQAKALRTLSEKPIKGRSFKVRALH